MNMQVVAAITSREISKTVLNLLREAQQVSERSENPRLRQLLAAASACTELLVEGGQPPQGNPAQASVSPAKRRAVLPSNRQKFDCGDVVQVVDYGSDMFSESFRITEVHWQDPQDVWLYSGDLGSFAEGSLKLLQRSG